MSYIKGILKKLLRSIYWRWRNSKDKISVKNYSLSPKIKIGKGARIRSLTEIGDISIGDYSYISGPRSYVENAEIGKYCSIARQVVIGVSDHNYEWVTTSPIITVKSYGFVPDNIRTPQKKAPVIGNDVWIGMNAIVLRGVNIGDGAIVAAGSIVTSDVKPYSIVGGVPAKHLRYRFTEKIIAALLEIKWWDWPEDKIKENLNLFYDIEKFVLKHSKSLF